MNEKMKASIVEECLAHILNQSRTPEECLLQYPEFGQELKDLFDVVTQIRSANIPKQNELKKREMKVKILNQLSNRTIPVTKNSLLRYTWQNTRRRIAMTWVIIVTTIFSLITGAGVVHSSNNALPGDALYGVKTTVEEIQFTVAPEESKATLGMTFIDKRINEMVKLIEDGRIDDLEKVTEGYQKSFNLMNKLMARIQEQNAGEASKLRDRLQQRLQEHARIMMQYMEGEGEQIGSPLQLQIQQILQTNTQAMIALNKPEGPGSGNSPQNGEQIGLNQEPNQNQNQYQNQNQLNEEPPGEFYIEGGLKYKFAFQAGMENGVYVMVNGIRYECTIANNEVICNLGEAPINGILTLYNAGTNEQLFQYEYSYNWTGEKEPGGSQYQYQYQYQNGEGEGGGEGGGGGEGEGGGGGEGEGGGGGGGEGGGGGQGGGGGTGGGGSEGGEGGGGGTGGGGGEGGGSGGGETGGGGGGGSEGGEGGEGGGGETGGGGTEGGGEGTGGGSGGSEGSGSSEGVSEGGNQESGTGGSEQGGTGKR